MHSPRLPRAYSYTRFSTPEQAKGDSAIRQALAAQRWAEHHGVELDNDLRFRDEGISAFDASRRKGRTRRLPEGRRERRRSKGFLAPSGEP